VSGSTLRQPVAADEVQGVRPREVIAPETAEATAAVLRALGDNSSSVVIRGGGTKMDWGRVPGAIDTVLDMSRMNRVLVHEHGDMTATVEAGATISGVNALLGEHGQWLPVDGGFAGATLGGMLASGDSGPLRHRFGTIRDLIIGVRIATTGGDLVQAGGRVVKNVAGYDIGKLMSGSQGSLAAIVSATFKLSPVLLPSTTLVARFGEQTLLAAAVTRVMESQLEAVAFDFRAGSTAAGGQQIVPVFLRFATTRRATEAALARARELLVGAQFDTVTGEAEQALWRAQSGDIWSAPGTVVRLSWPAGSLLALLDTLRTLQAGTGVELDLAGRAAVGAGLLRITGSDAGVCSVIERLRTAGAVVGAATVLRASPAIKGRVDPWDELGSSQPTLGAIKRAFDPTNTLNAGRGPI